MRATSWLTTRRISWGMRTKLTTCRFVPFLVPFLALSKSRRRANWWILVGKNMLSSIWVPRSHSPKPTTRELSSADGLCRSSADVFSVTFFDRTQRKLINSHSENSLLLKYDRLKSHAQPTNSGALLCSLLPSSFVGKILCYFWQFGHSPDRISGFPFCKNNKKKNIYLTNFPPWNPKLTRYRSSSLTVQSSRRRSPLLWNLRCSGWKLTRIHNFTARKTKARATIIAKTLAKYKTKVSNNNKYTTLK